MHIIDNPFEGVFLVKPNIFNDNRGSFFESFQKKKLKELINIDVEFVQDNQSVSKKGVLRGLHFQKGEHAQSKLVRVLNGSAQDIIVDIRPNSKTFGKHYSTILSLENNCQLFVPKGFAHGFLALENNTVFCYKCDNYYNKDSEAGIIYNDEELNINWHRLNTRIELSEKDLNLPKFKDIIL